MSNKEVIQKDYRSFVNKIEELLSTWEETHGNNEQTDDLRIILANRTKTDLPTGLQGTERTGVQSLGNGIYRLTSPNRSAVTGRFKSRTAGDGEKVNNE